MNASTTLLAKLKIKLSEVNSKRAAIRDGKFEEIFNAHYDSELKSIADESAFQIALDANRVAVDLEWNNLHEAEGCLEEAVRECEKQLRISKALERVGE